MNILRAYPAFRRYFLAHALSALGDAIVPVALAFAILGATGSAAALGLVLLSRTVPMVALLPVSGVFADRWDRRKILASADMIRFVSQGATAAALITGNGHLLLLIGLQAINGAATAFSKPAITGFLPELLPAELRQRANGLRSAATSVTTIAGPAVAGLLTAAVGGGWGLAVDAVTFLLSAVLISGISMAQSKPVARQVKTSFGADFLEGWRAVRVRTWLWVTLTNHAVFQMTILAAYIVAGPTLAEETLGGASTWAAVAVAVGIGSFVGSVVAMRWTPARPLAVAMLINFIPGTLIVALAGHWSVVALCMAGLAFGASMAIGGTIWDTALQDRIPGSVLSRVSSFDWLLSSALRPIGLAMIGPVVAWIGTAEALWTAVAIYSCCTLAALATPSMWSQQRTPDNEPAAAPTTVAIQSN